METLPLQLSNAINRELASLHPDMLRNACFELSQRYAQGKSIETQLHRQAYIAARLPATYGAVRQVFRRIEPYLKSIQNVLDLGAGVGSLAWAAADAMPNLKHVTLFERDIELLRMGQRLTGENLAPLDLSWCRDELSREEVFPSHDVVVLSYVLNELPLKEQIYVLRRAYDAADKLLILVEPGTPAGFSHILAARHLLIELGASIVAPCPHHGPCSLASAFRERKDWCHFSVRIPRGKYHRRAKEGVLPYEDEKYSYLVVAPSPLPLPKARVIKAPIKKTGHVILDLCTQKEKEERLVIAKSQKKNLYKGKRCRMGRFMGGVTYPL